MPTVRIWNGGRKPGGEVFASLEQTAVVLADIRAALPQLKEQLGQRWSIESIEIEDRTPRVSNPMDPARLRDLTEIMALAGVGIVVLFAREATKAAGKKVGDAIGEEIAQYVRGWIKRVRQVKPRKVSTRATVRRLIPCACGCGEFPKRRNSRFLPGHDLKKAYADRLS
jgi:hypothetical protein